MDELDKRFTYHAPDAQRATAHGRVRVECADLAAFLDLHLPDGREKALALTKLEEVMFWSNAAIAREGL